MNLIHKIQVLYIHYLTQVVLFCVRYARSVIVTSCALAVLSVSIAAFHLPIDAKQEKLVPYDSPFLQRERAFTKAFPQHDNVIIVVLEGANSWKVEQKAEALAAEMKKQKHLFKRVFYPQGLSFFQKNGLIYLDEASLAKFTDGLAQAQGAIATLSKDPSLRGLWQMLEEGIENKTSVSEEANENLQQFIKNLNLALSDFQAQRPMHDIWQSGFGSMDINTSGGNRKLPLSLQVMIIQPVLDYSHIITSRAAIDGVRKLGETLELEKDGITMGLTGREPLTADELASVQVNIAIAASISTLAIIFLLGFGIRSWRLVVIITSALFISMGWTLGWAVISVGNLNMVSAAFVVLFLGLCVDFSIHVSLRYREEYRKSKNIEAAMVATAQGGGGAISLCALATAIGFISFVPTDFLGLRDLGIIAGGSMILALLSSWMLLPAMLKFLPPDDLERAAGSKRSGVARFSIWLYDWVQTRTRAITLSALVLGAALFPFVLQMHFDYSTLALKDPNSESIQTLEKLFDNELFSDFTVSFIAQDHEDAKAQAQQFQALPFVRRVDGPWTFVPPAQSDKLDSIEEARFLLGPVFETTPTKQPVTEAVLGQATRALGQALTQGNKPRELTPDERELAKNLSQLKESQLLQLNEIMLGDYGARLARLELALQAEAFEFNDLPTQVQHETEASDGRIKISIYPKENLTDSAALERFVKGLQALNENISGRPVSEYEGGALIVSSFKTAILLAAIAISLLLLLSLRSVTKVVLVLVPIVLTAIWTLAACVFFGIAFNFVNILLLPLLLGMGVANGIHILARADQQLSLEEVMQSSTPVAIFLSNATTLASFGSMSIATHWGLKSMGITLSIAMVLMMFAALVVLPAIIALWKGNQSEPLTPK